MAKITEDMRAKKFNLNHKTAQVKAGESRVYKNWKEWGLVTEEEFIDALTWLCDDPLNEDGKLTRGLAMLESKDMREKKLSERTDGGEKFALPYDESKLKGELVKLKRAYDERGNFVGFYRIDTGFHFGGSGSFKVSISPMDRI